MSQVLALLGGLVIAGLALSSFVFMALLLAVLVLPVIAKAAEAFSGWRADRDQRRRYGRTVPGAGAAAPGAPVGRGRVTEGPG